MSNVIKKSLIDFTDANVISSLKEVKTIPELLEMIKGYGDKTAICDGKEYSFKELEKRIGELRFALKKAGVKKGDAVGILLPNSFDFAASAFAAMSYGAIAVLFPYHLDEKSIFGCSLKYDLSAVLRWSADENKTAFMENNNPKVSRGLL